MRDENKIKEEVFLSILEQFKNEIMELDNELEKLEKEKIRHSILKELYPGKDLRHEQSIIEDIEKKQAKIEKELDDKQNKLSKLEQIKKNYIT